MSNQNPIDGQLTIIDAEGNEKLCQILFTLDSEEFNKKYVVITSHPRNIGNPKKNNGKALTS